MLSKRKVDEFQLKPEKKMTIDETPTVSVIIALYNAAPYIEECLDSLLQQTYSGPIEISVHDDSSTDNSIEVFENWVARKKEDFASSNLTYVLGKSLVNQGAGAARNRAIKQSSGNVIVILDADDVAFPKRIQLQVECLIKESEVSGRERHVLVGSQFERLPKDATHHYTDWANNLESRRLWCERFRECTLIHPTWCYFRSTFEAVGGYPEDLAEDLSFFLQLGSLGAKLVKVNEPLVTYRHTGNSLVSKTPRKHLLNLRVQAFQSQVLTAWCHIPPPESEASSMTTDSSSSSNTPSLVRNVKNAEDKTSSHPNHNQRFLSGEFVVWGAGRDGRDFVNALDPIFRDRIRCMLDVDEKKIGTPYVNGRVKGFKSLPVLHWRDAPRGLPVVLCVSLGRTGGMFEANVAELARMHEMEETVDYWHFI